MRASDAFSWYQESDPAMHATIVALAWLDSTPDWARLSARLEAGTRLVPRLRQRVPELPAHLTAPRWVTDEDFELSWHLRRTTAATDDAVLELARIEAMTGLARCGCSPSSTSCPAGARRCA
jgi:hypothetical protein